MFCILLIKFLTVRLINYLQFSHIIHSVKMNVSIFMNFVSSVISLNAGPRSLISEQKSIVMVFNI